MKLSWAVAVALPIVVISGCDPADSKIYVQNSSDRSVRLELTGDGSGLSPEIPPHQKALAFGDRFGLGGPMHLIFRDGPTGKKLYDTTLSLEEVDKRCKGSELTLEYPLGSVDRG